MFGHFFSRKAFTKPPVLTVKGSRVGKTLLVTAGMDGDEYTGIEAAYALAEKYKGGNFAGQLVIVPVANVSAFWAEQSKNPDDQKYPKYIFPGNKHGSASEQLVHWLANDYVYQAHAWLDLHCGSLTETITPLLWTFKTGTSVDETTKAFIAASGAPTVVYEPAESTDQSYLLTPRGIMYALAESGGRGERAPADIARHIAWTESLMQVLGMLDATPQPQDSQTVCNKVEYVTAPFDCIVRQAPLQAHVSAGDIIATCTTLTGATKELFARRSGTVLYRKGTMAARKGDTLCAIGY